MSVYKGIEGIFKGASEEKPCENAGGGASLKGRERGNDVQDVCPPTRRTAVWRSDGLARRAGNSAQRQNRRHQLPPTSRSIHYGTVEGVLCRAVTWWIVRRRGAHNTQWDQCRERSRRRA